MLRGIFEHKRLKPTIIRTSQNLTELKQIMNTELKLDQYSTYFNKVDNILQDYFCKISLTGLQIDVRFSFYQPPMIYMSTA